MEMNSSSDNSMKKKNVKINWIRNKFLSTNTFEASMKREKSCLEIYSGIFSALKAFLRREKLQSDRGW